MQTLTKGQFLGKLESYKIATGIAASITSYDTGDKTADLVHYHEHPNFYFILNDGSIEKRKTIQTEQFAGSLLFYQAGEMHQNIRKGAHPKSLNVEIDSAFLQQSGIAENRLDRKLLETTNAKLLVLAIYRELMVNDALSDTAVQLFLLKLLTSTGEETGYYKRPLWVTKLRDILCDRWNETISLKELSSLTGVHPITISKYFPVYFTDTLGVYMRKIKIEKALALIRSDRSDLTTVAYDCGFADQSHFIRLFKKYTGFLPLQFRKL